MLNSILNSDKPKNNPKCVKMASEFKMAANNTDIGIVPI